jgi:DnaJ-class molecular chaperone
MTALIIIAFAAVLGGWGWWRVDLRLHPLRPCRWCKGAGKNRGSTRSRFGPCSHCGGSGRRVRATGSEPQRKARK